MKWKLKVALRFCGAIINVQFHRKLSLCNAVLFREGVWLNEIKFENVILKYIKVEWIRKTWYCVSFQNQLAEYMYSTLFIWLRVDYSCAENIQPVSFHILSSFGICLCVPKAEYALDFEKQLHLVRNGSENGV